MKKTLSLLAVVLTLGLTLTSGEAEAAKRFGGGKTTGMQRQVTPVDKTPGAAPSGSPTTPTASPSTAPSAAKAPAAAAAAQPKRSWMGPLAGLAAGLGLAALASHLGFGEEMASMMMFALIALAVVMAIGWFMRKRAMAQPAQTGGMRYASTGPVLREVPAAADTSGSGSGGSLIGANLAAPANIPADFDTAAFEREAKLNFLRMQAANDAGDLNDIRQFTSPELFAEIQMQLSERGAQTQHTRVLQVHAQVLEVTQDNSQYIVSVHYSGEIQEDPGSPAERFDEIWHLTKPMAGGKGWLVAGIQQAT